MRWTALVNPVAGRGRVGRLLPVLRRALAETPGAEVSLTVATSRSALADLAAAAFARGEGVLACGGDGTVADVANVAAPVDGLLGVVPIGSGNDFARALGLDVRRPLSCVALLGADTPGRERRVDLGLAAAADGTERRFTTVANAGFDAEVNRWANTVTGMRGNVLYVSAVLRTLAVTRPGALSLTVDGEAWEEPAWLVAVANTPSYGSGMRIAPDAEIDDGALDVCVVGATSAVELLRTFPRVYSGTHVTHPAVRMHRGAEVRIDMPAPRSPAGRRAGRTTPARELWASGERVGPLPARITALAAALRVLGPPDASSVTGP